MSPTSEPDSNESYDKVSIFQTACAPADALHCPKICNHLIAIAILLYHHYTKSRRESSEHVISAERDNLLDFTKCHRFPPKMNQNYLIMHVLFECPGREMMEKPPCTV